MKTLLVYSSLFKFYNTALSTKADISLWLHQQYKHDQHQHCATEILKTTYRIHRDKPYYLFFLNEDIIQSHGIRTDQWQENIWVILTVSLSASFQMLQQACVPLTEGYSEMLIITLFLEIIRSLSSLSRLFCSGCLDTFDYVHLYEQSQG